MPSLLDHISSAHLDTNERAFIWHVCLDILIRQKPCFNTGFRQCLLGTERARWDDAHTNPDFRRDVIYFCSFPDRTDG